MGRFIGVGTALVVLIAACGNAATDPSGDEPLRLVATTTILGDIARHVAGDDAQVEVLFPVGADPHDYQASSQDVAAIQEADLVIVNGLLLEEGLTDVLEGAGDDGANIVEVAARVDPIPFSDSETGDPHVWFDPLRMGDAARVIAVELAMVDPRTDWNARAEIYAAELCAAHEQIEATLAAVPPQNRKLVTNHDSLEYFAERYRFDVVGIVIPGGSTLAEPSSAELAALVEQIERESVPAIFIESTEPSLLADAVAAEVGAGIEVVELHTGSLGDPGSEADTLIGMLITNAETIAAALT